MCLNFFPIFVKVRGKDYLARQNCSSPLPCSACRFDPASHRMVRDWLFCFAYCNLCGWQFLKGLCVDDSEDFDTEYYVHGIVNGKMHFK